jgi:protein phosphatase
MGGMAAGDVASAITIEAMKPLDVPIDNDHQMDSLHKALEAANGRIAETVAADPTLQGMGTTLTAMLFSGSRAALAHVGDSRAYLLRAGRLNQLTKDDTYVQMLVDQGLIRPDEAGSHPRRAVVTQALQGEPVSPSYVVVEPEPGDRWLLCSDGLTTVVSFESIEATLRAHPDPQACADQLLDMALRGGGPDNISLIVADLTADD